MEFGRFSEEQINKVRYAVDDAAKLKRRAEGVIQGIKKVFDDPFPKESWGVSFEPSPQGWIAIDTPYGAGRGRLELSVGPKGSVGKFIIEKQMRNPFDQAEWVKVWHFRMDENGTFGGDETSNPYLVSGFNTDNGYAMLALSILYAIARGPE